MAGYVLQYVGHIYIVSKHKTVISRSTSSLSNQANEQVEGGAVGHNV